MTLTQGTQGCYLPLEIVLVIDGVCSGWLSAHCLVQALLRTVSLGVGTSDSSREEAVTRSGWATEAVTRSGWARSYLVLYPSLVSSHWAAEGYSP